MNSSSPRSIDTEQEINELYAALDERDQHIRRLEDLIEEKSSQHDEEALAVKDSQLNEYRDELVNSRNVLADLQIQIKCLREDNRELTEDKEHLEEEVSAHRSQADTLRTQLAQYSEAADEVKRLRKDGNQQLQRLELENQRLRTTVNELEQNENVLCNEIDTLVEEKSESQGKYEDLLTKCDSLYAELDETTRNAAELSELTHKLTTDLESERSKNAKSEASWQKRWADCTLEIKKLTEELELERGKETSKEYEANKIELAKLRHETQRLRTSHKQLVKDKHHAERDLDAAIKALNDSKANVREKVARSSERTICYSRSQKTVKV
jgi:chromosome segregation ATPase